MCIRDSYNTVDTLVVGNFVGTQALAAVGATSAFVQLLVGIFVGLCSGASAVSYTHLWISHWDLELQICHGHR